MVQWLGLCAFTARCPGSIPGWGTKIPQAAWWSQKKKETGKFMVALFDVTQQSQSIILICSQYRKLLRYFASLWSLWNWHLYYTYITSHFTCHFGLITFQVVNRHMQLVGSSATHFQLQKFPVDSAALHVHPPPCFGSSGCNVEKPMRSWGLGEVERWPAPQVCPCRILMR